MWMPNEYEVTLSIGDQQGTDVTRATTMLVAELAREGVPVSQPGEAAPPGSKSGIVWAGGSLFISGALSTAAIRSATQVILAFIRRGIVGGITVKDGDRRMTIDNASRETEALLVDWWLKQPEDLPDDGR
jgi:hypothetical protein